MSPVSDYLRTNNIPLNPISGYAGRGISRSAKSIHSISPTAAKGWFYVGTSLVIAIGAIETVVTAVLGTVAYFFHSVFNRSEFWQKQALLFYSYSLNCNFLIQMNLTNMQRGEVQTYAQTIAIDLFFRLKSAFFVQTKIGSQCDEETGRAPTAPDERLRLLVDDMRPIVIGEFQRGALMEVGEAPIRPPIAILSHMVEHLQDPISQLGDLLPRTGEPMARLSYPSRLAARIEEAFLEIYRTEKLWRRLDWGEEEGRSQLIDLDAQAIPPLCALAQLKELLMPIDCPNRTRRAKLTQAKETIQKLSAEEMEDLKQRLISTEGGRDDWVRSAFQQISDLAGELHQGALSSALTSGCSKAREKIGI